MSKYILLFVIENLNSNNPIIKRRNEFVDWMLTNQHYRVVSILGQNLDRFNVTYDNYNEWKTDAYNNIQVSTKMWILKNFTYSIDLLKKDEYSPDGGDGYKLIISFDTLNYKKIQTGTKENCGKKLQYIIETPQMYYFEA